MSDTAVTPRNGSGAGQASGQVPVLYQRFGKRYGVDPTKVGTILKATAFRTKGYEPPTNEQMAALLIVADQYNLNPFTKEIYAFPDKSNGIVPVVGIDGWNRIANEHDQFDGEEIVVPPKAEWVQIAPDAKLAPECLTVRVFRKDRSHPIEHTEYLDECYQPPRSNFKGPWQTHTKRMLEWKARIQTRRIAFGFAGIYDEDEAARIIEAEAVEVEDEAPAVATLDQINELFALGAYKRRSPDMIADVLERKLSWTGSWRELPVDLWRKLVEGLNQMPDAEEPFEIVELTEDGEIVTLALAEDVSENEDEDPDDATFEELTPPEWMTDEGEPAEAPNAGQPAPAAKLASKSQKAAIAVICNKHGVPEEVWKSYMLDNFGVDSRAALTAEQASQMIDWLKSATEGEA